MAGGAPKGKPHRPNGSGSVYQEVIRRVYDNRGRMIETFRWVASITRPDRSRKRFIGRTREEALDKLYAYFAEIGHVPKPMMPPYPVVVTPRLPSREPPELKPRALPLALRFDILKRDIFRCTYCGRRPPEVELVVDHVNPVAKGGTDDWDNLTTACSDCNGGKRDRLLDSVIPR